LTTTTINYTSPKNNQWGNIFWCFGKCHDVNSEYLTRKQKHDRDKLKELEESLPTFLKNSLQDSLKKQNILHNSLQEQINDDEIGNNSTGSEGSSGDSNSNELVPLATSAHLEEDIPQSAHNNYNNTNNNDIDINNLATKKLSPKSPPRQLMLSSVFTSYNRKNTARLVRISRQRKHKQKHRKQPEQ